jgi:RimJ/RimL family protein N-acetyltransferase
MIDDILSVREIQISDIELIASYWLNSEKTHLENMGVDINKLPTKEQFTTYLAAQLETPVKQIDSYCIIWQENNVPIGHSNTRPTLYGKEAFMHLHLWNKETRGKGIGYELVKLTLPYFFENLKLKNLYCEPYALNPAPNKTIQKAGFELVNEHTTTPGAFNFEQPVKRWCLSYEKFKQLYETGT